MRRSSGKIEDSSQDCAKLVLKQLVTGTQVERVKFFGGMQRGHAIIERAKFRSDFSKRLAGTRDFEEWRRGLNIDSKQVTQIKMSMADAFYRQWLRDGVVRLPSLQTLKKMHLCKTHDEAAEVLQEELGSLPVAEVRNPASSSASIP